MRVRAEGDNTHVRVDLRECCAELFELRGDQVGVHRPNSCRATEK